MRLQPALVSLLLVASTVAQTLPVGTHDVAWTNTAPHGTPILTAKVMYPATVAGVDQPVMPHVGGWPTIVFLHGLGMHGSDYVALGAALVERGFVSVMLDTAQWNYQTLEIDGRGMFEAIIVANAQGSPSPLLEGAFDIGHMGLLGHSMGGGVVGLVLANNPGYRCGLAMAPVYPGAPAKKVHVPFGIVVGHGDYITPWPIFSYPYFSEASPANGLKFLYVLDSTCDHMNVAGLLPGPAGLFERVVDVGTGFFDRFLDVDAAGLERCVGPAALAESHLLWLTKRVVEPQVWAATPPVIGTTVRISVLSEGGIGGALGALTTGPGLQTSVGTLMLDPASLFTLTQGIADPDNRIDTQVDVPNLPQLIGLPFATQAAGSGALASFVLGSAVQMFVQ